MVYLVLAVFIVLIALLLLRLRVRFEISQHRKLLFVGLGRSGPEFDLVNHITHVKVLGMTVKSISNREKSPAEKARQERVEQVTKAHQAEQQKLRRADKARPAPAKPIKEVMKLLRQNSSDVWGYVKSLWHAMIIEELQGQVHGGFSAPDLTGQAYGYYHALMGAMPALAGRFHFTPNWLGPSFAGNMRVAVALPLYVLVYRTIVLMIHLPLRRIWQLFKAKQKGAQDGSE